MMRSQRHEKQKPLRMLAAEIQEQAKPQIQMKGKETMKTVVSICAAGTMLLAIGSTALAQGFSWQTMPILGTDVLYNGDVVVITGPQPLDGLSQPYLDTDGNQVLGPTIPHYSMVGD